MKRDLDALSGAFDVVVVGGGIHGAVAACDAAQRGLRTALLERDDFGGGVSWNSLKTIHGGLRHLQRADVGGLRESAGERRALLRVAPRLVRPLPVLVPVHGAAEGALLRLGLLANDVLTFDRNLGVPPERRVPGGRLLTTAEARELCPGLGEDAGLRGAALWTDAQVDSSERLVLAFVRAAADAGAVVANHAEVVAVERDAGGRVAGVRVRDGFGGTEREVRARVLLNAAGPWMDDVLARAGVHRPKVPLLDALNLVVGRPILGAAAVGRRAAGRYLFAAPWRDRTLVGTAYDPLGTDPARAAERFLGDARQAFPWARLEPSDVVAVHRGRVPGTGRGLALQTRSRVLNHAREGAPGLLSLLTVKYTTARAVAETAVDTACWLLGRPPGRCRTAEEPLAHAHLPEGPLADRTRRAVREEMALTLADVVLRRLDLGTAGPVERGDLDRVAETMAAELGWTAERSARERATLLPTGGEWPPPAPAAGR